MSQAQTRTNNSKSKSEAIQKPRVLGMPQKSRAKQGLGTIHTIYNILQSIHYNIFIVGPAKYCIEYCSRVQYSKILSPYGL
jgi:hypothetical protein